ncbi:bacteriocin immunity protein [Pseudomonas sp. D4-18]|uniref:bacteriocin immunity protein n=1 Tax=Pseudomonas sp. R1-18 TaxID=1632772 RepID=UPI003DA8A9FE
MIELKERYEDYTESEFISFLNEIYLVSSASEAEHDSWIDHFEKVTEHPMGSDLFFHPLPGADCSLHGVLNTVKRWRAENGKPGFKPE